MITQKVYSFRIFHFHWSIIRGRICCEYIDYFKEDRYIYIWDILMDNYFKEVMVDGSIEYYFMEKGY